MSKIKYFNGENEYGDDFVMPDNSAHYVKMGELRNILARLQKVVEAIRR